MHHANRGHRTYNSTRDRREPVEDLREKLNRKRQEDQLNEGKTRLPPPDPAYNFLRDPLRGDELKASPPHRRIPGQKNQNVHFEAQHPKNVVPEQHHKQRVHEQHHFKPHAAPEQHDKQQSFSEQPDGPSKLLERTAEKGFKTYSGRNKRPTKEIYTQNRKPQPRNIKEHTAPSFSKESMSNILVEVSGESGERKCVLDDTKTIEVPKSDNKQKLPAQTQQRNNKQQQRNKYNPHRNKSFNKNDANKQKEEASASENAINERKQDSNDAEKIEEAITTSEVKENDKKHVTAENDTEEVPVKESKTTNDENQLVIEEKTKENAETVQSNDKSDI